MDDAALKRMGRENLHRAVLSASAVAIKIDGKYGTFFNGLADDKRMALLRLRAVALAHFVPVLRVVEIIREKYGQRDAGTGLGLRLSTLCADKVLAYAAKELAAAPVRRVTKKSTKWTAKGLASMTDEQLRGEHAKPRPAPAVRYPYRGRPE